MESLSNFWLDQPRSTCPCFSCNSLLDERSEDLLREDLTISCDMRVIYNGFFGGAIIQADEIPREGWVVCAIGQNLCSKARLVSNNSGESFASDNMHCDRLARIVVGPKFVKDEVNEVVDSRDDLELDSS